MATDKRLDQVSTLTDFDYALIVKGDQVAKVSKQQLAELVGNLLYGATNASSLATVVAGMLAMKNININPDNIRTTSFWSIVEPSTDLKLPTSYGVLLCFLIGGSYTMLQIVYDRTSSNVWHRTSDARWNWSEWLRKQ